ncbi:MAG TPA: hypothetical protein VGD99_10345 [Anaerolineae bacterium]|jgi:diadenosine tetraphosphate (Ap4A) HIT family hydrolase
MADITKDCVFCDIAAGKAPAHHIFEDDLSYAILDSTPLPRATAWCCPNATSPGGMN